MLLYRTPLLLVVVFLLTNVKAGKESDFYAIIFTYTPIIGTSVRSPTHPLISYRLDSEDDVEQNDQKHADDESGEASFDQPSKRHRKSQMHDETASESTTSIRSPTQRLIAYRLDEEDDVSTSGSSRRKNHAKSRPKQRPGQDNSEEYYDYVEKEKSRNSEPSTNPPRRAPHHVATSSGRKIIQSPTNRLISYRLDDEDSSRQFTKAKKGRFIGILVG